MSSPRSAGLDGRGRRGHKAGVARTEIEALLQGEDRWARDIDP